MANIFTLENVADFSEKLNIDELYERKRQHDLNQLALYNKLLNRIHIRIKTTARPKTVIKLPTLIAHPKPGYLAYLPFVIILSTSTIDCAIIGTTLVPA
jgi:hypothetical protein